MSPELIFSYLARFVVIAHFLLWVVKCLSPKVAGKLKDLIPSQQTEVKPTEPSEGYLRGMTQPVFRLRLSHAFSVHANDSAALAQLPSGSCTDDVIFRSSINRYTCGEVLREELRQRLDTIVTQWLVRAPATDAAQYSAMLGYLFATKCINPTEAREIARTLVTAYVMMHPQQYVTKTSEL